MVLKGKCKDLFFELISFTDNLLAMNDFIELLEEWVAWNKGKIRVALINLNDYGFPNEEMFVAFDDMSGTMNTTIYHTLDFVDLIIDILNDYEDEEYLENFWIPRLEGLIKDNEY